MSLEDRLVLLLVLRFKFTPEQVRAFPLDAALWLLR